LLQPVPLAIPLIVAVKNGSGVNGNPAWNRTESAMSKKHGAREQKKLAKQKAKHNARRKQLARQSSSDPMIRLKSADRWPIVAAMVPENLWEMGLGQLVFARRMPDGDIACAGFLVDVFCLGVKNAFWQIVTGAQYDELVERVEQSGRLIKESPEYFSKLVHCAADYAQALGFPPHRDFRHARLLLAGIDPSQCHDEFEFGKDGVPLYVRGPNESMTKAESIAARVRAAGGHFVFMMSDESDFPESDLVDSDDDDYEDDYDDEIAGDDDDHIIDV
jgi:hypothetical protein